MKLSGRVFVSAALCVALVCPSLVLSQRRVTTNTGGSRPNNLQQNTDTRLGLLAGQLGVAPVPGGGVSTGSQTSFPGAGAFGRDDTCWCQPVNQVCTNLRPNNLDLVTRIINRPGSPGGQTGSGRRPPNCNAEKRLCCPQTLGGGNPNPGFPNTGFPNTGFPNTGFPNTGFPNTGFPNTGFPNPGQSGNLGASPGFGQCGVRRNYGIPGISPIADVGEYPWMAVVLGSGNSYLAGGVLIGDSWVLTAPHKLSQTSGLSIRLGDYDVGQANELPKFPHYEVPVKRVIIHPQYNAQTLSNDVALLQLVQPINFQQYGHVTPACLPGQGQIFDGQRCFVSGWGKDAFGPGQYQRLLQEVDVPVVDSFRCENLLRATRLGHSFNLDKKSFICAGGELNKDACQGDGGSPLVCGGGGQGWTVAGLVAWGVGCAQRNVPAAYVNVAAYTGWIRQYVH